MKKFKFFALAFAALSFAACSDDVIDGKGENTGTGGDATPAYLTISFTANSGNSSRSTADDANNNGDQDGSAEDSGHHNTGNTDERKIEEVLVVITPSPTNTEGENVSFAQLYNVGLSATDEDGDGTFIIQNASNGTYANAAPIELTTGNYNVLVVANPVSSLTSGIVGLGQGIHDSNDVENLYTTILSHSYDLAEDADAYQDFAAGQRDAENGGKEPMTIMMANKGYNEDGEAYTINLKPENTPEAPAVAYIDIERVYSKITYRTVKENNVYEVDVNVGRVQAETVDAAININESQEETAQYEYRELNVAKDLDGKLVYVRLDIPEGESEPVFKGAYAKTSEKQTVTIPEEKGGGTQTLNVYTLLTPSTSENPREGYYHVASVDDPLASLTYQATTTAPSEKWYVKLEGYALTNLSNSVYYVRHTTAENGLPVEFGELNGTNYLYTPYWKEKNSVSLTDDDAAASAIENADDWFYNTLAQVSEESKSLSINGDNFVVNGATAQYYKPFATLVDEDNQNVTAELTPPSEDVPQHGQAEDGIGQRMAYCFENSTDRDHQIHGLSTGISFVARIYTKDENNQLQSLDGPLYRYSNHLFRSLEAIYDSFKSTLSDKFKELLTKEQSGETITREMLEQLKNDTNGKEDISLYEGGLCYYYTTEIKHYDNGDNAALGNMEFAIMRNNIYSLAVTDINMIGDPFVDPTPNIPDEYPDNKTALNVEIKILPWIVRYNDIEF